MANDINRVSLGQVYPGGASLASLATGHTPMPAGPPPGTPATGGEEQVARGVAIGGTVNPLIGMAVLAGTVLAVSYVAQQAAGADETFASLRGNVYNALVVSGFAVVGIPLWKALASLVPIPGVSTWILSV